jgi:hypothetical protein
MDTPEPTPGVELAPLPREQVGPFLILGVPKDADADTIEAHWAQRILWARQGKTRIPLADIHWARAVLRDPEQRLAADVASLNPDTAGDELRRLARLYGLDPSKPGWPPLDPDPPAGAVDVPDPAEVRPGLPAPAVPMELPGVARWLEEFARAPLDPWGLALPPDDPQDPAGCPTPPPNPSPLPPAAT